MPNSILPPKFLEPGAGLELVVMGGDRSMIKLASHETTDKFSFSEYTVLPQNGPPLHVHEREDEVFYVLEGEVNFWVNGKRVIARPGAFVFGARGTPHTFKNCSDKPARMLLMVNPGANFEHFFSQVVAGDAQGNPPSEETMIQRIMAECPPHGMTILGPNPL